MFHSASSPGLPTRLIDDFLRHNRDYAVICLDAGGTIVGWYGAAEEIFGYSSEEAVGASADLIFTAEDVRKGLHEHELVIAREDSRAEDDRWHVRKDGTRIWATGSAHAIKDADGTLHGYVKVVCDKTDLRCRLEALENHAAATAQGEAGRRVFLSTLGHELRNPLAPLSNAAMILDRLTSGPTAARALDIVKTQIKVLTRLAEDLMDVSRVNTGKVTLALQPRDLRVLLTQVIDSMQETARRKGLEVGGLMPHTPLDVSIDEDRFSRVVLNLLGNAIKFTDPGGHVWVKGNLEGPDVVLRVEDTGVGISPEMLPRIFELFTQEGSGGDHSAGGLGIGLSVVKELVELHGGSVQARSPGRGKGAEFTVRLPRIDR